MDTLRDILHLFWLKKKFWLIPIVVLLLAAGLLMIAAESAVFAPFVYAIF